MLHTIAIGLERKLESSNKKIETLASKSKSLANSLKAEKLKSRSAMEHLLLLTTTQTEELIATFHARFTQLKTEHDIAIQKSQRISVNELVSNQKSIKHLIRSHDKQMKQLNGDYTVALAEMEKAHNQKIVSLQCVLLDDFNSHYCSFAMQVQEQQKKDACVKSLHTKQDGLRTKLCALQDSLDAMKGRLHDEKSKRRKVMFDEELKCKKLKNEIQDLNDWIFELDEERKVAKANKKVVREKYYDTVRDAQYHLHRWHQEREKHHDAENKMAELDKHAKKQDEMYAHLLEDFNEITSDPKRSMQKEWDDE